MLRDKRHRAPVEIGPKCIWHGPVRDPSQIRVVVIHDTEGGSFPVEPSARSIAQWGASTGAIGRASWHFAVDEKVAVRCLPDDVVAWTAPGTNLDGLQIEMCGYARWTTRQWFQNQAVLKRSAWVAARWCVRYRIPVRWLTDRQLADGATEGLTTHRQASRVFRRSDHTDPGPNFPRGYFLWLVKRRVRWLQDGN